MPPCTSDILQTVFHEGVHLLDLDNELTIHREMLAWKRTIEFAQVNNLNHELLDLYERGGEAALRQDLQKRYRIPNPEILKYNKAALKRKFAIQQGLSSEADINRALKRWIEKNIIPIIHERFKGYQQYSKTPVYDNMSLIRGQIEDPLELEMYLKYLDRLRRKNKLEKEFGIPQEKDGDS